MPLYLFDYFHLLVISEQIDIYHLQIKKKENNIRVAVVTGAGSGIGKAVAIALIKEGFHVYLVGRNKKNLNQAAW